MLRPAVCVLAITIGMLGASASAGVETPSALASQARVAPPVHTHITGKGYRGVRPGETLAHAAAKLDGTVEPDCVFRYVDYDGPVRMDNGVRSRSRRVEEMVTHRRVIDRTARCSRRHVAAPGSCRHGVADAQLHHRTRRQGRPARWAGRCYRVGVSRRRACFRAGAGANVPARETGRADRRLLRRGWILRPTARPECSRHGSRSSASRSISNPSCQPPPSTSRSYRRMTPTGRKPTEA
jgi:hypothetical protein